MIESLLDFRFKIQNYKFFAYFMEKYFRPKNSKGFSLIEVSISIFVFTLVVIAIWAFQHYVFSLNATLSAGLGAEEEMRRTFKTMTSEIRAMSSSNIGAYPIAEANSTSFIFYQDLDDDGLKERIRYFLDDKILKKGTVKPSGLPLTYDLGDEVVSEVIHNVANGETPIFNYYDANYDGATPPMTEPINLSSARLVKITVAVDRDPARPPGPLTMTTQVSVRNLKDNL